MAEALLRTVGRSGIAGVSVRSVAAEAGVTGGTVQHYFRTRSQMLHFAMELVAERIEHRLLAMPRTGPPSQWTRSVLLELLPLSAERREEFNIWLAFTAHAETDAELSELRRTTSQRLAELYRRIVAARRLGDDVQQIDVSRPSPDALLLQAVIDGLSLHLAQESPQHAAATGPQLLDHYLTDLDRRTSSA